MKTLQVLILLLLGHFSWGQQQSNDVDSLKSVLTRDLPDTSRISTWIQLTKRLPDSVSHVYVDSILQLSLQLNYDDGLISGYEKRGHILLNVSFYDSAISFYSKSLEISIEANLPKNIAAQHDNIGTAYFYKGDYNKTLESFKARLAICEEINDPDCISPASNNIGVVLISLGQYEEAIQYNLRSLEIDEANNNQHGIMSSQMSLGNLHFHLKNYEQAREYFEDVIKVCESMGGQNIYIAFAYNNIGSILYEQRKFQEAADYYERSLTMEKERGSKNGIAVKYNNLGSVYKDLGDPIKAEKYYLDALSIRKEIGDLHGQSSSSNNLGQLYLERGSITKAIRYYKNASDFATKSGSLEQSKIAYEGLAKSYKKRGNTRQALANYEVFTQLKDSLLNEENTKQIAELEAKFENEKKQREIETLNQASLLDKSRISEQEAKLQQRATERNLLIGGIVSVIIIAILLIRNYHTQILVKEKINEQNKEFEAMRSSFFSSISHEFRTPLTLISAPVDDLIKKNKKDPEAQWTLELVKRNAGRLLRLINQLLDLSKLEAGKLKLFVAKEDIISWLRVVAASFESLAISKELVYETSFPATSPNMFFDKEKLEQAIVNLLSNAFKFTPPHGKVLFQVTFNDDLIEIKVTNEGHGIPHNELDKIFDRFYQVSKKNKPVEGTGIGLAIVKEFITLHHGNIHVESSEEGPTTFAITLPTADVIYQHDEHLEPAASNVSKEAISQLSIENSTNDKLSVDPDVQTILIAEDNADLRQYMAHQLSTDYAVLEAQNGEDGFELSTKEIPDLIITDLMMPKMNGLELLQGIRNNQGTNHIPVIMLTAKDEREDRLAGIEEGADHYLTKPFDMEELQVRIKSLLSQRARIRDHYHKEFMTNPKSEHIQSIDDKFLQKAVEAIDLQLDNHEFSVDQFAKELAMSRVQLHRKMKAIIGCSASEFMRNYRLKKAYQYLKNKKGSVSEVAYSVGFNNLSYFTKSFKEVYKSNPSEIIN